MKQCTCRPLCCLYRTRSHRLENALIRVRPKFEINKEFFTFSSWMDASRSGSTTLPFSNPWDGALTAVQTAPASAQQQYERYFSLALLFVTCRAEITPLHSKISIGNPLCGGKTTGWVWVRNSPRWNWSGRASQDRLRSWISVLSTKAHGHPIWRWSFLADWSAAQRDQLSPARSTHAHARAHTHIHRRFHTGRSYVWYERYCVNWCQLWTTVFLFLRRYFIRMRGVEREKPVRWEWEREKERGGKMLS